VRVNYPSLGPDAESAWARVLTPSAGNARGILMLPVIGEEVLIGFEHDDTTRPYVLGSLFNGVDKPGDDLLQDYEGSFALLSDHKVHISAIEEITIDGQKLNLKADNEITLDAGTTLTLKCGPSQIQLSSNGVTVSGPMINLG